MKKLHLLLIISLSAFAVNAQGVYKMWGMTQAGGADNRGTIFSTDSAGNNFQLRHQFTIINQGLVPEQTEPIEYNGKFYGMTYAGGRYNMGVIFEWDPITNIYTKKFDFDSIKGKFPYGSLTLIGGKFYGMTNMGGSNNLGVIFEWDPITNIFTKEFEFDIISNGYYPQGSLTLAGGKLYGMTWGGGTGAGVIFEFDPVTNVYTIKKNFDVAGGARPLGDLTLNAGKLYGMTRDGGSNGFGVIFELDPATNIYTTKIHLNTPSGRMPTAKLTFLGSKFYGMMPRGGTTDAGVIFEWDPATNIYVLKYSIDIIAPINGFSPKGSLAAHGGKLYGLMSQGGINNAGVLFEFDPTTNIYTKKFDFNNPSDGGFPNGTMTFYGNKFFGLTKSGGTIGGGVIFEWDPTTNIYIKRIELNASIGFYPAGILTWNEGVFFGLSQWGGNNNRGTIFEWNPSTGLYNKKIDLNTMEGSNPYGSLSLNNGIFYGMTEKGGINNTGVIFEWAPVTNIYTKKVDLNTINGNNPTGSLVLNAGKFYGTTKTGGSNNLGVIFEWDPVTNIYTKKIDLNTTNGSTPTGSLVMNGGMFYGMTSSGGNNNAGVIFEWNPSTNIYTKKIDFSIADGSNPNGSLALHNGKFYGMTKLGGSNNLGAIFEWDPITNIYTKKIDFNVANGSKPLGSLLLNVNRFYGTTNAGGSNDYGVVFEWNPVTNIYTKKNDLNGLNGRNPSFGNDLILAPASVSRGNLFSCEVLPTVTIDNSNNNKWVPVVDSMGDIAAEINANGNNLGDVSTSLFTKNGACREDASNRLYLNRNITITPQTQPVSGNVSVRIYIRKSELDSLKTAINSLNQPSGVTSINEVDVFKNDDNCTSVGGNLASPLMATNGTYYSDYYLQVSVSSFSSFYFANKLLGEILPVKIKSFTGKKLRTANELRWEANCNTSIIFNIERSLDGIHYETIGNIAAADCNRPFYFTDNSPFAKNNYYRLGIIEPGGIINYSSVILLDADKIKPLQISVQPNLISGASINAELATVKTELLELTITDVAGRKLLSKQLTVQMGINNIPINVSTLPSGIYWLYVVGKESRSNVVRFVKQ